MDERLLVKYDTLKKNLKHLGRVIVAFSGGVDSTLMLYIAVTVLGKENVRAVTLLSETVPEFELNDAKAIVASLGVAHDVIHSHELSLKAFVENPENKCYICKKYRFGLLKELSQGHPFPHVVDGSNADDNDDYRPGMKALKELGILSPLSDAGFTKQEVRQLSKEFSLPTWNKPSYACLATRIPYHREITAEKLKQVKDGEEMLKKYGFSPNLRVRHFGDTARIEIDPSDFHRFSDTARRQQVVSFFKGLGFIYVTVDLEGYNMGSMNKTISSLKEKKQHG